MTAGLSASGFTPKPYAEALGEIEDALRAQFGSAINLSPQSAFGQIAGVLANEVAAAWDLAQAVYDATNPDAATGAALDAICAISGTVRRAATKSSAVVTVTGAPGTVLSQGREIGVDGSNDRFETTADVTIAALLAWATTTPYVVGDRRTRTSRVYEVTVAGTSGGTGPSGTGSAISDGGVTWRYIGEGTGAADVAAEATAAGPVVALAGDLIEIETPVSGWQSVTNLLDAETGTDEETDAELRIRREAELRRPGNATVEAIRATILDVTGVESCTVYENPTDTTDGDGVPPHAIEALVLGGDDDAVAAAIFASVAAGILAHGTTTETVTDSQGIDHDVGFTRPDEIEVYVIAHVTFDADKYPDDGDDQVAAAILALGETYPGGLDVRANALRAPVFAVSGVLDVPNLYIGTAPTPSAETTITITTRQIAAFDSSRISVVSASGTP